MEPGHHEPLQHPVKTGLGGWGVLERVNGMEELVGEGFTGNRRVGCVVPKSEQLASIPQRLPWRPLYKIVVVV